MYRIGDFSKLTNLSVKTLRYYNEIGILIPEEVDIYTGYRYYGNKNLEQIKIITELKQAGFTLEEIKTYWNNFDDEKLLKKKEELYQEINNVEKKIKKIDELRSHIYNGKIRLENVNIRKIKKL